MASIFPEMNGLISVVQPYLWHVNGSKSGILTFICGDKFKYTYTIGVCEINYSQCEMGWFWKLFEFFLQPEFHFLDLTHT